MPIRADIYRLSCIYNSTDAAYSYNRLWSPINVYSIQKLQQKRIGSKNVELVTGSSFFYIFRIKFMIYYRKGGKKHEQ